MNRLYLAYGGWALGVLLAASAWGYEKSALSGPWSLQPAVSPDTEPAAAWWKSDSVDWRHNGNAGKGTPWAGVTRGNIHSL